MTRAAVAARAALITGEPPARRLLKRQVPLDVAGLATVELLENTLTILITKLVQQLVGADDPRFNARFLSQEICHRLGKLAVVGNTRRRPVAVTPKRPSLPPLPHDDDEITFAQNRVVMLAGEADALNHLPLRQILMSFGRPSQGVEG